MFFSVQSLSPFVKYFILYCIICSRFSCLFDTIFYSSGYMSVFSFHIRKFQRCHFSSARAAGAEEQRIVWLAKSENRPVNPKAARRAGKSRCVKGSRVSFFLTGYCRFGSEGPNVNFHSCQSCGAIKNSCMDLS